MTLACRPLSFLRVFVLLCACVFLGTIPAEAAAFREIKVPYGLSWGDGVDKVRDMLRAFKGKETGISDKAPGRTVLEAEDLGIGQPLMKKTLFMFKEGSLVEIEQQFNDPGWDGEKAADYFGEIRRRVDERYGPGTKMVEKLKEKPADNNAPSDMTFTLIVYRWSQPTVALELNLTSVEGSTRAFRLVSLHYKTP